MPFLLVRHKVADFAQWKKVFNAHAQAQRDAGLHIKHVLRNNEDPDEIVLFFEVTDMAAAHAFVSDPAVKGAREQASVVGPVDVTFLN